MSPTEAGTPSGERRTEPRPGWKELARAAASRRSRRPEREPLRQFITLMLSAEVYAVPVEAVREIVRLRPITPLPRVPPEVCGVISLRGEMVQVLDLRLRLGVFASPPSRATRIVVLHGDEGRVTGLLVDGVTGVLRVTDEAIQPAPGGESDSVVALCTQGDEFVSILNLERVVSLGADS